jgi:hypothetical protein
MELQKKLYYNGIETLSEADYKRECLSASKQENPLDFFDSSEWKEYKLQFEIENDGEKNEVLSIHYADSDGKVNHNLKVQKY